MNPVLMARCPYEHGDPRAAGAATAGGATRAGGGR